MEGASTLLCACLALPGAPQAAVLATALSLAAIAMLLYFLQRFGWLPDLFARFPRPAHGFLIELEHEDPEHPHSPEEQQAIRLYHRAYLSDIRGRHRAAAKLLRQAIKLAPQWRFHVALASTLNILEQQVEALTELEHAQAASQAQLKRLFWDIPNLAAGIKADLGRPAEALADFAAAERLCDEQDQFQLWRVYKDWGTCYLQMDDYANALAKYEQAWQVINFHCLRQDQELASLHARTLLLLERPQEGVALLERAEDGARSQHEQPEFRLLMAKGMLNLKLQRYPQALQAYTQAGRVRRPLVASRLAQRYFAMQDIDATIGRGTVLARQGKYRQAAACLSRAERQRHAHALDVNPQLSRLYAAVLLELKQVQPALDLCERALALMPPQPGEDWLDLASLRCQILFQQQRYGEALPALDTVVQQRQQVGLPEELDLHINRSVAASNLGYTTAALAILDYVAQARSAQGLPPDPEITYRKAVACLQGSDHTNACQLARQALQEYFDLDPHNPGIIDIQEFLKQVCPGPRPPY
jgi:tetratricopeptide (TPR) repeat protein